MGRRSKKPTEIVPYVANAYGSFSDALASYSAATDQRGAQALTSGMSTDGLVMDNPWWKKRMAEAIKMESMATSMKRAASEHHEKIGFGSADAGPMNIAHTSEASALAGLRATSDIIDDGISDHLSVALSRLQPTIETLRQLYAAIETPPTDDTSDATADRSRAFADAARLLSRQCTQLRRLTESSRARAASLQRLEHGDTVAKEQKIEMPQDSSSESESESKSESEAEGSDAGAESDGESTSSESDSSESSESEESVTSSDIAYSDRGD